ncbi:aspartate aminotransferase family protein [Halorubellus sp. JP-L1]|uniref:pyridoxal phosphate-dependent decarboxylase family protein n=1 Tax=Halorubellus sp. JP-L1 TaxID=2715753 RepID=UPI00140C2AD7|nr:pyridoxal-dependent decarboxylase [Halorubellus sp. JP-L1]NHN41058.1 aspartate aminotransferase family protein [Halorubellus sp. JP-L1]
MSSQSGRRPGELDPDAFRELGYRAIDLIADYYGSLDDRPVYVQADPSDVVAAFDDPLPESGEDPSAVLDAIEADVLRYATHNPSPRFFGYVMGGGLPIAALADAIAAALNMNVGGWHPAPSATEVERTVVEWLADAIGYPTETMGLLTSGGTMANVVAVLTAFRDQTNHETRQVGLQGEERPTYALYVADHECHSSIYRAADMLNLGRDAVRLVPSNDDFTMDVDALEARLDADEADGDQPFCVVAQAGSINVSAIDPLDEIASVCDDRDLWFHVDGACGAVGAMLPELADRYAGIERADSVTLDPHKWLNVSYECGAVLVHDRETLAETFAMDASYLRGSVAETPEEFDYYEFGPQMSRGFRALKVWASLKQLGVEGYRENLRGGIARAAHLDERVRDHDDFEAVQEPNLFIYSFRYVPADLRAALDDARGDETDPGEPMDRVHQYLDRLNQAIVDEVVDSGLAFLTTTTVHDRRTLRTSICNHRTTDDDVDVVFEALADTGARLDADWRPEASLPI